MLYIMEWNDSFCKLELSIFSSYIFGHWHRVNYNHFLGIQLPDLHLLSVPVSNKWIMFVIPELALFHILKIDAFCSMWEFCSQPSGSDHMLREAYICNECKNIYINIFIMIKVKIWACFSSLLKHWLCT